MPAGGVRAAVPSTFRVTLVSPKLTLSNGALISQRYSPASSWVTLFKVTVAPSMVARPSKEPKVGNRKGPFTALVSPWTVGGFVEGAGGAGVWVLFCLTPDLRSGILKAFEGLKNLSDKSTVD